jgi:glycosyltransferase involved in cell wall biosynthesis
MKITLIGPVYPYRGGISSFTTSLSIELALAGHEVQTISFKRQYPQWLYPGQSDKDPSLVHDQVPASYLLDPIYFWTWFQTVQQIAKTHPDLVIIQWWTTFWAPSLYVLSDCIKRMGVPCVFCIHNVFPHENKFWDKFLARLVLSNGTNFITLSPKESDRLKSLLPEAQIFTSHLPVPRIYGAVQSRLESRTALNISEEKKVLLFFGIVRPYKGLKVLLDALALLKQKGITPLLIVAGEFWDSFQDYQLKVETLSLADQVIFINQYIPNEELAKYFIAADGFVAPYLNGTQSGAIKMAMSFRLPILASDQIAGDLPVNSYPIFVHHSGVISELADSIQNFFRMSNIDDLDLPIPDNWVSINSFLEDINKKAKK